jgi:ABC-type dipeptide/oligopeptide/nickel transport system permease subunit
MTTAEGPLHDAHVDDRRRRGRGAPAVRRPLPDVPVSVLLSMAVLTVAVLCAVVPAIAPHDPTRIVSSETLQTPSAEHLLGTDQLGRDVLSRMIHGARTALIGPVVLAIISLVLGAAIALVAGYRGGWIDAVVGRVVDALLSVPPIVVAIVVVGVAGGGYWVAIGVLVVFRLPHNVRVLRAAVAEKTALPYVEAARTLGVRTTMILGRHLLPAIRSLMFASLVIGFTYSLVELSSLSFLGLGVPPGSPDWGRMLSENRVAISSNLWSAMGPGLALIAVAVSTNLIGEWLYARSERRSRQR